MGHSHICRKLILVTGAPRTATTPVGDVLNHAPDTTSVYEPMGPTGDIRFSEEFPMPGTVDLDQATFQTFLDDLPCLSLDLKSQKRRNYKALPLHKKLAVNIFGSRTLHSLRLARLDTKAQTVIWKDPHAVMAMPDILAANIPVVVTVRPALAHAASYKQKNWQSPIHSIYERYKEKYGADEKLDHHIAGIVGKPSAVQAAAAVWRMVYKLALANRAHSNIHFISSLDLERDEIKAYETLFSDLGLPFEKAKAHLEKQAQIRAAADGRDPKKTHDWTRSLQHTNSYWQKTLSDDEVAIVRNLTDDIEETLQTPQKQASVMMG